MAERFQKLYSLTPNMYIDGCPVLIEAGVLQKDTESGVVLAQIKMQNIGEKPIESCKISLKAYENNGDEIEGVSDFSYLDLKTEPGTTFGGKTPIIFPNETTRSFSVDIKEIVFDDKTVEAYASAEWKTIPSFTPLSTIFEDAEIEKQYGIEVGGNCEFVPERHEGLFLCTCGGINNKTNSCCCKCGRSFETLLKALNKADLGEKAINRLADEQAEREHLARVKEESRKKNKKLIKIACAVLAVIVLAIGLYKGATVLLKNRELEKEYIEADAEYKQGDYYEAATRYAELGDYKDSQSRLVVSCAKHIQKLIENKQYDEASAFVSSVEQYMSVLRGSNTEDGEAVTRAYDSYYSAAEGLIENKDYENAKKLFSVVKYKDSEKYTSYCDAAIAVSGIGEKSNLTEIYQMITALDNFADADSLINNNEHLSAIKSLDGEWEAEEDDSDYLDSIVISVYNGEWHDRDYYEQKKESIIVLYKGKIRVIWKDLYDKDDYRWYDDFEIKGDKLILNERVAYKKVS